MGLFTGFKIELAFFSWDGRYCVNNAMLYRTGNSALKGQTAERACETAFIVPTRLRLY